MNAQQGTCIDCGCSTHECECPDRIELTDEERQEGETVQLIRELFYGNPRRLEEMDSALKKLDDQTVLRLFRETLDSVLRERANFRNRLERWREGEEEFPEVPEAARKASNLPEGVEATIARRMKR